MKAIVLVKDKTAVAGVIEFILLIAMFAIILALIQVFYIPEIMAQDESENMEEISNQFSRLKTMIDIQSKKESEIPLSTRIPFGNKQLPYFVTVPSSGYLSIVDRDITDSYIEINDQYYVDLTDIKYKADNAYFTHQDYIYEGGGVIIKQPEGNPVMWQNPSFNASPMRDQHLDVNNIVMYFDIPVLVCKDHDNFGGGYSSCYITTNYSDELSDSNWNYLPNFSNITIKSDYSIAWFKFINKTFEKDVKQNISFYRGSDFLEIREKGGIPINFYYRKKCIFTRID